MCYHVTFGSATIGVFINSRDPKMGSAGATPPCNGALLTAKNKSLPRMCYDIKFGSYATLVVRINRKNPKMRSAGTSLHPGWDEAEPLAIRHFPQFGRSNGTNVIKEIRL